MVSTGRQPVVDVAFPDRIALAPSAVARTKVLDRFRLSDNVFRGLTLAAAICVLVLLSGVIFSLLVGSVPTFREFGLSFLVSQSWNPVTDKFGALPAVYGTVVTSFIA